MKHSPIAALTVADLETLYADAKRRRDLIDAAHQAVLSTPEGLRFQAIDAEYCDTLRRRARVAGDPRYVAAFDRHHERLRSLAREWDEAAAAFQPLYDAYRALVDEIVRA